RGDAKKAMAILEKVASEMGAEELALDDKVAKVSIVGVGMRSHPGVAARLFKSLADAGVNIDMISTSEIKVACVVRETDGEKAVGGGQKGLEVEKPRAPSKGSLARA